MRPLRLEMTAFGPYAGKQVIDFRDLGDRNFFLITGPTGAGKTAMLDAMCFALYGDTSGAERDARQMRSDHAAADVITEVTFDFTLGEDTYRVTRSPEQMRASRRGGGLTKQTGKASLWKRSGCADDDEGDLLASKLGEVSDRVEQLMGFTSSEFRQVVVLPQGRFRQLLTADSSQRERILEALFSTEDYRRIQDALKQRARSIEVENAKLATRRQEVLEELGVENREAIVARREQLARELEAQKLQVANLLAARALAREALAKGKSAAQAHADLERARRRLAETEAAVEQIAAQRGALDRARRALPLREMLRHRDDAANQARAAVSACRDATSRLGAAERLYKDRQQARETEHARASEREAAVQAVHHFQGLAAKSAELVTARERLAAAGAAASQAEQTRTTASSRVTTLEQQQTSLQQEARALGEASGRAAAQEKTVETLRAQQRARVLLERKRAELEGVTTGHGKLSTEVEAAEEALAAARAELVRLQQAWDVGQAGVLAADLEDGHPCPVCGSTVHPATAAANAETPRQEQIESARAECVACDHRLGEVRTKATAAGATLASVRSEIETIAAQLGTRADEEIDSIARATEQAQAMLAESRAALERVASVEAQLDEARSALGAAREQLDAAHEHHTAVTSELGAARAVVAGIESDVPVQVRDPDALALATREAVDRQRALETSLEKAIREAAEADSARAARAAELESAKRAEAQAVSRSEESAERLRAALTAADFDDETQLRDALVSEAEIDTIEARVMEHDRSLAAARAGRDEAEKKAAGIEKPELAVLEAAASQADGSHDAAVRLEADVEGRSKALGGRLERLDEIQRQLGELQARYETFGRIAQLADGRNDPGMPFHRFVLAALLDSVLWAASERLRVMSNNRYSLRRSTERGSRRKSEGLELEVDDAYTGVGRPVGTLSGGEGFLASLSLALGLADVVQGESGGIRLDAIFVDEGFGTLDPEALDLAVRALVDLQEGGRMVGIISHVPELKERVEARLEVMAGKDGSRARFTGTTR